MSISCRFRAVSGIRRSIVVALGILLVAPIVAAGPQLWLYPEGTGPREGDHIVPLGGFTLVIENRSKASDENEVLGVELIVAVNDPTLISTLTVTNPAGDTPIEIDGGIEGIPELLCSHKPMPRHGVYPMYYTNVLLGDLEGGQLFEVDVVAEGEDELRVHFDAIGISWKTTGNGPKCSDVSNPAGHDVTVGQRPGGRDDCGRVRITKTADQKYVDVGDMVIFEIEIINEGSCDLTDPILRDFIPSVEDESGKSFPAFTVIGGSAPLPDPADDYLLEWTLESPLPAGGQDGALIEVEIDPVADGHRVVNRACISANELRKARCTASVIIVGNPNGDDGPAGPGFWCHAVRFALEGRHKAPFDAEDLENWLSDIGDGSEVFHDEYDASTPDLARDLLCSPQFAHSAADRLLRHLLTLWFNVVSGRLALDQELEELCDGDELMPEDVEPETVMALITDVEDALLDPGTDDQTLTYWSEVVDAVNNALVRGEPGCMAPLTTSGRQRTGLGNPGGKLAVAGN